jgi:D-glycero-D-manno-heptose 1,7-bisphosphate phosphatase
LRELSDMAILRIHQKMHARRAQQVGATIDAIFVRTRVIDSCDCRKPKAGMFNEIQALQGQP